MSSLFLKTRKYSEGPSTTTYYLNSKTTIAHKKTLVLTAVRKTCSIELEMELEKSENLSPKT